MSKNVVNKLSETTCIWLRDNGSYLEDLNHQGDNGDFALMKATREGKIAIVKELLDVGVRNNGNNALWFACFGDRHDLIHLLINSKINIDNQNDNGATALMYTASAGKTDAVKLLLKYGANLDLKNLDDFKALDFANNTEVLRILKHATK